MKKSIYTTVLIFASILLMNFTIERTTAKKVNPEPTGTAYAITWQNDYGYWYAVGPVQALWSGYETEEEALALVRGYDSEEYGYVEFVDYCGKFKVYNLGVEYNSYDTDAVAYAQKKGYACSWP